MQIQGCGERMSKGRADSPRSIAKTLAAIMQDAINYLSLSLWTWMAIGSAWCWHAARFRSSMSRVASRVLGCAKLKPGKQMFLALSLESFWLVQDLFKHRWMWPEAYPYYRCHAHEFRCHFLQVHSFQSILDDPIWHAKKISELTLWLFSDTSNENLTFAIFQPQFELWLYSKVVATLRKTTSTATSPPHEIKAFVHG